MAKPVVSRDSTGRGYTRFRDSWCAEFSSPRLINDEERLVKTREAQHSDGDELDIFFVDSRDTAASLEVEVVGSFSGSTNIEDVEKGVGSAGGSRTVWLDERNNFPELQGSGETREYENPLTPTGLLRALTQKRFNDEKLCDAARRLIYISDLSPDCIHALAATTSSLHAHALRSAIFSHLAFRTSMGVKVPSKGYPKFELELNLPFFILRKSPPPPKNTHNTIKTKPERGWTDLSFLGLDACDSKIRPSELDEVWCLQEAQITCVVAGTDDWRWTAYGFVDSKADGVLGELSAQDMHFDRIAGQQIQSLDANFPIWTPRDYWIKVFELRIAQVTAEYKYMTYKFKAVFDQYMKAHTFSLSSRLATSQDRVTEMKEAFDWALNMMHILTKPLNVLSAKLEAWRAFYSEDGHGDVQYFYDGPSASATTQAIKARTLRSRSIRIIEAQFREQHGYHSELVALREKCKRYVETLKLNLSLGKTHEGHLNSVTAVTFSPDGKLLASASSDNTVLLWDAATGAALQTLGGHSNSVTAVAFSPDGTQLVSASADRTAKLWDTATGAALQTLEGYLNSANAVAFSPDGKLLASASSDKTIRLWDPVMASAVDQTLEGASKYPSLQPERSVDKGFPALERDGSNESIEPRIKPHGPFSDSGYMSNPSSAAPNAVNDSDKPSIHGSQNIKQLASSTSDGGDNQNLENEQTLGVGGPETADGDLQSVVSDREEISSQISTRKTQQELLAERHLTALLAQHEDLKPLYEIALEQMGKERFVDNFRRILKRYYLDLIQSANTNLQRATVHLLRSRWSRVRMAQDIVNRVLPESVELYAQLSDDIRDIEDKIPALESWIAGNLGLAPPLEPQDIRDEVEVKADDLDDAASDSDWEEEEQDVRSYLLPNIADMESFLLQGNSFRSLVTNTCLFLLPGALNSLSRVLMTIPYDRIYFSPEDNRSILNRVKGFVEDHTEENWNWWPLERRMRPLAKDQTRVYWKCHCGSTQWAEISLSQAELYRLALRNRSTLQNNHLCRTRPKIRWHTALRGIITKMAGPVSTRTQPFAMGGITQQVGPQNIQLKPSGSGAYQASNISRNPIGSTTNNQNVVQINIGELSSADLYVLFGVKGPRRSLELEQIAVRENSDDNTFFQSLTQAYKKHRGFWRYWFSVWQLTHCDFVKFIKLRAHRIIHHSKSLPEDIIYEYQPRPPTAENPPILPHEFELAFSACSSKCLLSAFHDCVEPPSGAFAVERIPKRKSMIEISSNSFEFAWGIQAQHAISFLRMVLYHLLIFASTFGLWAWWLVIHPNDLQNAAVPLTTVAVFLSLFWGSAGVLKVLRE